MLKLNTSLNDTYNQTLKKQTPTVNAQMKPINTQELAKSPYGDLELTKHLYENGLQNIFSDYQRNMNTVSQQEQSSLQDAYFIKEMSKKYLGEYASNTGLGDVSGNLIDIYSNYNQNVAGIKANADMNELSLTREYQSTKQGTLENIMRTQFQIDVAKLQDSERDIMYNISIGNTDGLKQSEYLDKAFKDGKLTKQTYQALQQSIKMTEATQLKPIMNKTNEDGTPNENYIGDDYDFKTMFGDENVDKTSVGFTDYVGNRYLQIKDPVDNDAKFTKSSSDLFQEWKAQNGNSIPVSGDVIYSTATDSNGVDRTVQYIYQGDTWYRLAQEPKLTDNEMKLWYIPEDGSGEDTDKKKKQVSKTVGNVTLSNEHTNKSFIFDAWKKDKNETDSITINGVKYQIKLTGTVNDKDILEQFKRVHGTENGIRNNSFIMYKNKVYAYENGKILSTVKK